MSIANDAHQEDVPMFVTPGLHYDVILGMPWFYKIWDKLDLEGKKSVVYQIASIQGHLASLEFSNIGWIYGPDGIGPIHSDCGVEHNFKGPLTSTADYLSLFLPEVDVRSVVGVQDVCREIRSGLQKFLAARTLSTDPCRFRRSEPVVSRRR